MPDSANDRFSIFIVEDEALVAMQLREQLVELGYIVCGHAARGEHALDQIPRAKPDLVLMDINIPGDMDGIDVAERLRGATNVPVVFLSAHADEVHVRRASAVAPAGFLVKPYRPQELFATLQTALTRSHPERRPRATQVTLAAVSETIPAGILQTATNGHCQYVNRQWCALAGMTPEEAAGEGWIQALHPDDRDRVLTELREHRDTDKSITTRYRLRRPDGSSVWVDGRVARIRDGAGNSTGRITTLFDASAVMQTDSLLRALSVDAVALDSESFTHFCTKLLAETLGVDFAYVAQLRGNPPNEAETLAVWADGGPGEPFAYRLDGSPCRILGTPPHTCVCVSDAQIRYPDALFLAERGINAYAGAALTNRDGKVWGLIAVMSRRPFAGDSTQLDRILAPASVLVAGEIERRRSEERFHRLFESAPDATLKIDDSGTIVLVNRQVEKLFDYQRTEILGQPLSLLMPGVDWTSLSRARRPPTTKSPAERSVARRKDSSHFPAEINIGELEGVENLELVVSIRDVTERESAERKLRSEQEFLRLSQAAGHVGSWMWNIKTNDLIWSDEMMRLHGQDPDHFVPSMETALACYHPEDAERIRAGIERSLTSGWREPGHFRVILPDGAERVLWATWDTLQDSEGRPTHMVGVNVDVTERIRAEQALVASEERLRRVVDHIGEGLIVDDKLGRVVFFNDRFADIFGLDRTNPSSLVLEDYIAPEYRSILRDRHDRRMRGEAVPSQFEYQGLKRDGTHVWIDVNVVEIRDADGEIVGTQSSIRDITVRRRAEARAREALATLDASLDIAVLLDAKDLHCLYVNAAVTAVLGYSPDELIGRFPRDILESADTRAQPLLESLLGGNTTQTVFGRFRRKDGGVVPLEVTLRLAQVPEIGPRIIAIARDVSDRLSREAKERRAQRLESIGSLVGGIAHDLNNALAPVTLGFELLKMEAPESDVVESLARGVNRATAMVRRLLDFVKGAEGESHVVDARRLVHEVRDLLAKAFPANILWIVEADQDLPAVLGDSTQLHQALVNLCVNARDAMPNGGTLSIALNRVASAEVSGHPNSQSPRDGYLRLSVTDTGTGIAPEIVDRVFDPFFTTKDAQAGTGLGLSTVMGIAKGHGGFIEVSTVLGKGTTFALYLPVTDRKEEPQRAASELLGGQQVILLVDDEAAIRAIAGKLLARMGFVPLLAEGGAEAIATIANEGHRLTAVLTDLSMPNVDGLEVVRALRAMRPGVPVAVVSGWLSSESEAELNRLGVSVCLEKPFTQARLADALKTLLGNAGRAQES